VLCFYSHRGSSEALLVKVGASPETKKRLRELQAQVRDWRPPSVNEFDANEAVVINLTQPAHVTFSQSWKNVHDGYIVPVVQFSSLVQHLINFKLRYLNCSCKEWKSEQVSLHDLSA
jgi:hypothetical protein